MLNKSLLVCGVGNIFRGDDSIGPIIVGKFSNLNTLPEWICIKPEIDPLDLPLLSCDFKQIIIVDAAEMHKQPGEYSWFDGKELAKESEQGLHSWGISEGLSLMYKLNPESEVSVLLIQAEKLGWFDEITTEITNRINEISALLNEECLKYASCINN